MIQNTNLLNGTNDGGRQSPYRMPHCFDSDHMTGFVHVSGSAEWTANDRIVEAGEARIRHTRDLFQAVADCLLESVLVEATARNIRVRSANAEVNAVCPPLARPLVVNPLRSGPTKATIALRIDAEASDIVLGQLVVAARKNSPAFDLIAHGVKVEVSRFA